MELAERDQLAMPRSIKVRSVAGEKFDRIVHYDLGPKQDADDDWGFIGDEDDNLPAYVPADDDLPF